MRHFKWSDHVYGDIPSLPLLFDAGISFAATDMARFLVKTCADGEGPRDQPYKLSERVAGLRRLRDMRRAMDTGSLVCSLYLKDPNGRTEAKIGYEQHGSGRLVGMSLKDYTTPKHTEQGVVWSRDESGVYVPHENTMLPLANGRTLDYNEFVGRMATLYSRAAYPHPEESVPLDARGLHVITKPE